MINHDHAGAGAAAIVFLYGYGTICNIYVYNNHFSPLYKICEDAI
jgi:hypothetical protein